eukprot:TRINITY_DN8607_c0_g1_i3.p1 TRINITY_DN8607_c0_g1~~TRINITY_DN8607_c0_g1_i3.p1  ORF type:complete len:500 (+),score=106.70 TRINITY_DN8607_c0_g1_i3:3-1502(+)
MTQDGEPTCLLTVAVKKAHNLPAKDRNGLSDPFVTIACAGAKPKKVSTKYKRKTLNPVFNETLRLKCPANATLDVVVYDKDTFVNDVCGRASIDIEPLQLGIRPLELVLELKDKDQSAGTLIIELSMISTSSMFGMALNRLCDREGGNIPTIVTSICSVVERHLNTEGVYRVPGQLSVVRDLMSHYDAGKFIKEPDNDDAVLARASTLKKYLSELPQPLFTNALYPELISAVKGHQDESARVSALCQVLRHLPAPWRTTAACLVKHMHKVAANAAVNKMTLDNLAVCFAPTILSPAPPEDPKLMMQALQNAKFDQTVCRIIFTAPEILAELEQPSDGVSKLPVMPESSRTRSNQEEDLDMYFRHHAGPDGCLGYDQFQALCLNLGVMMVNEVMFDQAKGASDRMSYPAFVNWWHTETAERMSSVEWETTKTICQRFQECDRDQSGTIDRTEFQQLYKQLEEELSFLHMDSGKAFEVLDKDGSGFISVAELVEAVLDTEL